MLYNEDCLDYNLAIEWSPVVIFLHFQTNKYMGVQYVVLPISCFITIFYVHCVFILTQHKCL